MNDEQNNLTFDNLLDASRRFSRDDFVTNLGGIVSDVGDMMSSEMAQSAIVEARNYIDSVANRNLEGVLPEGFGQLLSYEFGRQDNAPELVAGQVAAIDGTPVLPLQKFSAGQALCVGIGSRSYTRLLDDVLHGYTSKAIVNDLKRGKSEDIRRFLERIQEGLYNISQTAYMRYFEAKHALDVPEPYIFCDGTLVYEWLVNQYPGREIYKQLLSTKQAIGIMKSTKDNVMFSWLGRALKPGEVFIFETLYSHVTNIERLRNKKGERVSGPQWSQDYEFVKISKEIVRGIFKPAKKHFGFECHADHLENMLRIMSADCQMNLPGHEIPFLLNEVDKEIRRFFKADMVQMQINQTLSQDGEDLFIEETDERNFR